MFHKRVVQYPLLQAFDGPDAAVSCGRRNVTTVAPQALALLNDPFVRDRAADFARRLLAESDATTRGLGRLAAFDWRSARPPSDDGARRRRSQFLETQIRRRVGARQGRPADEHRLQALTDFCQALFSLNEFIYVD